MDLEYYSQVGQWERYQMETLTVTLYLTAEQLDALQLAARMVRSTLPVGDTYKALLVCESEIELAKERLE